MDIEAKEKKQNIWLDGIMGAVVGDALGVPVEFCNREALRADPVLSMRGYGTYNMPAGTWSDDSSMILATLDALRTGYDPERIMQNFVRWKTHGEYTPFGEVFDIGNTCARAIAHYMRYRDITRCGGATERDNGNGSLMRILPICLYAHEQEQRGAVTPDRALEMVHEVSALTHAHLRSWIACGLYYFLVRALLTEEGTLHQRLQRGLDTGRSYYRQNAANRPELSHYDRLRDLSRFRGTEEKAIRSSGYVVDTLEAALWCLLNSESYEACVLKAVNLGEDTDTVATIAGGLAGLWYGYEGIPREWLEEVKRREWVEYV